MFTVDGPFRRISDGAEILVRLTPKASANAIRGVHESEDGAAALKAAVTAPPEGGKANAALLGLIAKAWKLPKSSLSIASGATSRRKVVRVAGDPAALFAIFEAWIKISK